jgi:hypothetical protein
MSKLKKDVGSSPEEVSELFFNSPNTSSRTTTLELTETPREMSNRKYFWGVERGRLVRLTISPPSADFLGNVGSSTSRNPIGFQGLLQRKLHFLLFYFAK